MERDEAFFLGCTRVQQVNMKHTLTLTSLAHFRMPDPNVKGARLMCVPTQSSVHEQGEHMVLSPKRRVQCKAFLQQHKTLGERSRVNLRDELVDRDDDVQG